MVVPSTWQILAFTFICPFRGFFGDTTAGNTCLSKVMLPGWTLKMTSAPSWPLTHQSLSAGWSSSCKQTACAGSFESHPGLAFTRTAPLTHGWQDDTHPCHYRRKYYLLFLQPFLFTIGTVFSLWTFAGSAPSLLWRTLVKFTQNSLWIHGSLGFLQLCKQLV